MATSRPEASKEAEAPKAPAEGASAGAAPAASGGLMNWLPLGLNVILMPVLAYVTTVFFLLPKLKTEPKETPAAKAPAKGEGHSAHGEGAPEIGKSKFVVPLGGKVLVNIAGTMGTRYLLANLTLVSTHSNLKDLIDKNDPELRDVAAGVLATKTIADLEKPGARNLIRTELISVFNNVIGDGIVSELYLTEFAIQ
ncbi:MAG: flagellar basal body-associated FliL family protein [Verrucomicrobiota bacterium]